MKLDPKKTVFLIDGSSFLYRAYYSMPPLHTPKGEPVQAFFCFVRMLKRLIDAFKPQYMVLTWDSKGKTVRHDMYSEYKATRQEAPSDLSAQKELVRQFADLIGLAQIAKPGIEADDLMYSLAQERKREGDLSVFVTSDKDMAQAIDDQVVLLDPFKYQIVDQKKFEEKYGFPVKKLPFYFSLLGDSSDNIPGVRGIGKKGATELVQQFESLEALYANLDNVEKKRARTALEGQKENAFLSRDLFLLQQNPSGLSKEDCAFDINKWVCALPLFVKCNFKSLVKDIEKKNGVESFLKHSDGLKSLDRYDLKAVRTAEELKNLVDYLKQKGSFALDTETDSLSPTRANLVGLSLAADNDIAYYVPCGHITVEQQLTLEEVKKHLGPILVDKNIKKYLHHTKFDQLVLSMHGLPIYGVEFETLLAARLVAKPWQRINLKALSSHYLGERMLTFQETVKDKGYKTFAQVPIKDATAYAAADALQTFRLASILKKELEKQNVTKLFASMELPLSQILLDMESEGIILDADHLNQLNKHVTEELCVLEEEILALIGPDYKGINLNSPRQVEKLLFVDLLLPPQKKSAKKTSYSTDQEVLTILSKMHPVPGLILKYRELTKLKSTYLDALPTYINPKTGKVHTSYSQTIVATGRLASSDPNLQNIPAGTGHGLEIRAAFKPRRGDVFLSADYSQIELRILAHLSQDKNLLQAFLDGRDIHAETAARLFDVQFSKVSTEQRQVGKRINFSILYGLTPYGLSKDLNISFSQAKQYIEKYFAQYPGVSRWMDEVVSFAKEHGYVQTVWGRRRYVPAINENNKNLYEEARRVAINTVAQGTAADIIKLGMIEVDRQFKKAKIDAKMILQIHDELLISASEGKLQEVEKIVKQSLENVVDWKIPLVATLRSGSNWKEVTK